MGYRDSAVAQLLAQSLAGTKILVAGYRLTLKQARPSACLACQIKLSTGPVPGIPSGAREQIQGEKGIFRNTEMGNLL